MTSASAQPPNLTITIELPDSLSALRDDSKSALNQTLREAAESGVSELMKTLGVPGSARVAVTKQSATSDRVIRLMVDGRPTRYPDELLALAYGYVNSELLDLDVKAPVIVKWLKGLCENADDAAGVQAAVEFVSCASLEIIKRQPAVLLGEEQVSAYAQALRDAQHGSAGFNPPAADWLRRLLAQLLEMRISLANVPTVASVLAPESGSPRSLDPVVEDLIDVLRAGSVEIQVPRALLRQLTTRWEQDGLTSFPALRDGLLVELGIDVPPFKFVAAENLKANSLAFKVNHVASLPFVGLRTDQCLVNDSADNVRKHNIDATPTMNPATGQPGSVIDAELQSRVDSLGFTTWNQMQHLTLCVTEFLRRYAWCTVHRRGVHDQLENLETYFPKLVATVRARHSEEEITLLLRSLVRERVSVQNLRAIFEAWLDSDLLSSAHGNSGRWRGAVSAAPLAIARVGLGHEIANRAARRTSTVVVYLLDPEIERLVSSFSFSQIGERGDAFLNGLRAELAYLPPNAQVPNVLTFAECRATLQQLVVSEFPRMSVIAHEELPPGINVMPIARIKLEENAAAVR